MKNDKTENMYPYGKYFSCYIVALYVCVSNKKPY